MFDLQEALYFQCEMWICDAKIAVLNFLMRVTE